MDSKIENFAFKGNKPLYINRESGGNIIKFEIEYGEFNQDNVNDFMTELQWLTLGERCKSTVSFYKNAFVQIVKIK